MEKKKLITGIVAGVIGLALVGTIAYLYVNLDSQRKENKAMQELADLDKKEMENEYQQFANQYSEMKTQITNDSIVAPPQVFLILGTDTQIFMSIRITGDFL